MKAKCSKYKSVFTELKFFNWVLKYKLYKKVIVKSLLYKRMKGSFSINLKNQ